MSLVSKRCQKCYVKTLSGKGNPMFGKKRPDLIKRNKINIYTGKYSGNYKDGRSTKPNYCKCGAKIKFRLFKKLYKDIKIKVLMEKELRKMKILN